MSDFGNLRIYPTRQLREAVYRNLTSENYTESDLAEGMNVLAHTEKLSTRYTKEDVLRLLDITSPIRVRAKDLDILVRAIGGSSVSIFNSLMDEYVKNPVDMRWRKRNYLVSNVIGRVREDIDRHRQVLLSSE